MADEMKKLRVGCYGAKGSYTYEAMERQFGEREREEHYYPLFEDVLKAVSEGVIDYGVVPIENSSTGGITEVYDLIMKYDCAVVGEQLIKIEHNLLGVPGATIEDIDTVYSHPQGFAQCRPFFNEHRDWTLKPYFSTSRSAEKVAEDGKKNQAAVAGRAAAKLYGLSILKEKIFFNDSNCTRFFVIGPHMEITEKSDKITLVIAVRHEPGALYHVLGYFFYGGMNMTHLESRPMAGRPFEYFFHIDVTGRLMDPSNQHTLKGLESMCTYFKILGNYPSCISEEERKEQR